MPVSSSTWTSSSRSSVSFFFGFCARVALLRQNNDATPSSSAEFAALACPGQGEENGAARGLNCRPLPYQGRGSCQDSCGPHHHHPTFPHGPPWPRLASRGCGNGLEGDDAQ